MGLIIGVILVVLLAALVGYVITRPATFRVERRATIQAPPEKVFPLINDLRRWDAWSPWEKKDPDMKRTFGGAQSGQGATYGWDGDKNVGQGRMEILESVPPSKIVIKLDFFKPFEAHNITEFALQPRGDATDVHWSIHGPNTLMSKIMGLCFSMDKMIGTDFEAGLAAMTTEAEK